MFIYFLEHPFFSSRPRLQRALDLSYRVMFSSFSAILIAIDGAIIGIAAYLQATWIALIFLAIAILVPASALLLVLLLIADTQISYRVKDQSLIWQLLDETGNEGTFSLTQTLILTRDAEHIHIYLGLDEFVDAFEPFPGFEAEYEGHRKKITVYLRANYPAGREFKVTLRGKRNVTRANGNRAVEIPIDFPIEDQKINIQFAQIRMNSQFSPRLHARFAGELRAASPNEMTDFAPQALERGYEIKWARKHPQYGRSYLINW